MNKQSFAFKSIRQRLIWYFMLLIAILVFISVMTFQTVRMVSTRLDEIVYDYASIRELGDNLNALHTEVEYFLASKSSDSLLRYYSLYYDVNKQMEQIPARTSQQETDLINKNIRALMAEYLQAADDAIVAKRARKSLKYATEFEQASQMKAYIEYNMDRLLDTRLTSSTAEYERISGFAKYSTIISLGLIACSGILAIGLAIFFTNKISRPLLRLSEAAEEISEGNYDVPEIQIKTQDELQLLAEVFNKMVRNVRDHIDDLITQAEMEKQIKKQETDNLLMKNLLKEAELRSLQTQINPHFLYNSLNAASQLSFIEGADRTAEFINKLALHFRRKLKDSSVFVTIEEELSGTEAYLYILKMRFGDRIEWSVQAPEELLGIHVPSNILQPVVENAFVHGLESVESGGHISIRVWADGEWLKISVHDNGIGMTQKQVHKLIHAGGGSERAGSTGIGIRNISERIRLLYSLPQDESVLILESEFGEYTLVTLRMPLHKEGNNAENHDSGR